MCFIMVHMYWLTVYIFPLNHLLPWFSVTVDYVFPFHHGDYIFFSLWSLCMCFTIVTMYYCILPIIKLWYSHTYQPTNIRYFCVSSCYIIMCLLTVYLLSTMVTMYLYHRGNHVLLYILPIIKLWYSLIITP